MTAFLSFAWPALAAWLIDVALQSSLLLMAALVVTWCFRQPAHRVVIAWSALTGLLLLSLVAMSPHWPRMRVSLPQPLSRAATAAPRHAAFQTAEQSLSDTATVSLAEASPTVSTIVVKPPMPRFATILQVWQVGLVLAWLASAAGASLWILFGSWQVRRVLRAATRAPEWTEIELKQIVAHRRPPRLRSTRRLSAAAAVGAWQPSILLPEAHVHLENRVGVQAALKHEWAHIRHGDLWLLALERLLLPLYAWQPLFWLLRRQLRIDQELLADAAAAGDQPVEYAEALLEWARLAGQSPAPAGLAALAMFENPRTLSRRIEMVLNSHPVTLRTSWLARSSVTLMLLAVAVGLSLVTLQPRGIHAEDPPIAVQLKPTDRLLPSVGTQPAVDPAGPRPLAVDYAFEITAAPAMQIKAQCVLIDVDHGKLEAQSLALGEMIQASANGKCTLEGNVIVATLQAGEQSKLFRLLEESKSAEVLSSPRILTLDGQEATVQVGPEVVVAEVEETVNGKPRKQTQTRVTGTQLLILPKVDYRDGAAQLTLTVRAETTAHVGVSEKSLVPAFKTRRAEISSRLKSGEVLLLAEQPPRKKEGEKDNNKRLLVVIMPELVAVAQAAPTPAPDPDQATKADAATPTRKFEEEYRRNYQSLTKQNEELRKELDSLRRDLEKIGARPPATPSAARGNKAVPAPNPGVLPAGRSGRAPGSITPASGGYPAAAPENQRAEKVTRVYKLQYIESEKAVRVLESLKGSGISLPTVVAEPRTNSLIVSGSGVEIEILTALLAGLDRTDAAVPGKTSEPAISDAQLRLLELDVREAEAKYLVAKTEVDQVEKLFQKGVASTQQLQMDKLRAQLAEIALERAKVRLDAARKPAKAESPATSGDPNIAR